MKKILSLALALALLLSAISIYSASAEYDPSDDLFSGDYCYEILEDGTAAINGYLGSDEVVVVPSEIEGYKVTVIHRYAFAENKTIESITLPEGVTRVGFSAFRGCAKLETLVLPDSLQGIHRMYIENTKLYNTPENWEGGALYIGNHLVTTVPGHIKGTYEVREGTVSIGNMAFEGNEELTEVILPDSLHTISDSAFGNCENLEKINLHDNITTIGFSAFSGCKSLKDIRIPAKLKEIAPYAFRGCGIEAINIPESVEKIDYYGFAGCNYLESVTVPESVKYIGDGAFSLCDRLADITLPDTLDYLGRSILFESAYAVNHNNWENDMLYYGTYLLDANNDIKGRVYVKEGTKMIAASAFSFCHNLSYVYLPDSVDYIGLQCFGSSEILKEVRMPKEAKVIEPYAFLNCPALESIIIPEGVEVIPQDAFLCCDSLNYIRIPDSVATIDEKAVGYDNPYYDTEIMEDPQNYIKNENLVIAGNVGTKAESYAKENGFTFKDITISEEHRYKDKLAKLWDIPLEETNNGTPYLIEYTELFEYYSEENSTSTPDYVLVRAYENIVAECTITEYFGDYVLYSSDLKYPGEEFGYHIYLPETNEVFTLTDAWNKNIEGIENVFTKAKIGELMGDINYDEKVNIRDATLIQKHLAGLDDAYKFAVDTNYIYLVPDYNRDGKLNIRDATAIQKFVAKLNISDDPDYTLPKPQLPEQPQGTAAITFNGNTYNVNVGDIVTVSSDLFCEDIISSLSMEIKYDAAVLNALRTDRNFESFSAQHCPNLENFELIYPGFDYRKDGYIHILASDAALDFTKEQTLCYFSFRVVGEGTTDLTVFMQSVVNSEHRNVMNNNVAKDYCDITLEHSLAI